MTGAIEDIYPLSPTQRGMLAHLLSEPRSRAYFEQFHCELRGVLDGDAFAAAWQAVVARQPVLRTTFDWEEADEPLQVVLREAPLPFPRLDWRGLSAEESDRRLREFLRQDRERGFSLTEPPLMRLVLIQLAEDRHRFVWSHHHLLLDGWCRPLLFDEVLTLYEAARCGAAPRLGPVRPFRDYIAWLQAQDAAATEAFWRGQLRGYGGADLAACMAAPGRSGERAGEDNEQARLCAGFSRELEASARRHGVTLNTLVQAAWALLLSRYGGGDDLAFGIVVSGRPPELAGVESMVGLFINSLPLRLRVPWELSLASWLPELQRQSFGILEHSHVFLGDLRRWCELPPGRRLFDALLAFQNFPVDQALADRIGIEVAASGTFELSEFPLSLVVEPGPRIGLWLGFDCRVVGRAMAARMLRQYEGLLRAMVAAPAGRLRDFEVLTASERWQLLGEWNDTGEPPAARLTVPAAVAERARRTGEAMAVLAEGRAVSYRELLARAGGIARALRAAGLPPGAIVAVLVERTPEHLAALLGVLLAGAAVLPLDPAYPRQRLRALLDDSRAAALLGARTAESAELAGPGLRLIDLAAVPAAAAPDAGAESPGLGDLACVFYTSGSTGRPKGVALDHRALAWFALEMAARLDLSQRDRMLQFASPAFDVLLEELFPVWLRGGAVVLESSKTLGSPAAMAAAMRERGVTVAELPAPYWHAWVSEMEQAGASPPASLRLLLVGAEKPAVDRLAAWQRYGIPLLYVFGLTETAVTSSCHLLAPRQALTGELPIGRPLPGVRYYVSDAGGGAAPLGTQGELQIGGAGVAVGYLGRPEATAERFVPDPFSSELGARLYRTGDLVRHRPDGALELLGRADAQVKVRGFRIELGEIEAAMRQVAGVAGAAVALRAQAAGEPQLTGYVCPGPGWSVAGPAAESQPGALLREPLAEGRTITAQELRAHLRQLLPDHMVPAVYVAIPSLPLTANGKLDRRALPAPPAPAGLPAATGLAAGAPSNEVEALLAGIFCEVLGLPAVGIHDNFFELGGDSILSIQVAARARRYRIELAPWQLFEQDTIAKLAAMVAAQRAAKAAGAAATPAAAAGPASPAPTAAGAPPALTPIQRWFFAQDLPQPAHWNMSLLLAPTRRLAPGLVRHALGEVAARHEALACRFVRLDGAWSCQLDAARPAPALAAIDLSRLPVGAWQAALADAAGQVQRGFDLGRAPLLAAAWFEIPAGDARLLLAAHHLVVDAVSWRILVDEMDTACGQLLRGEAVDLAAEPIGFGAWSLQLAAVAGSPALAAEGDYWLAGSRLSVAPLPVDLPAGRNLESAAASVRLMLPAAAASGALHAGADGSGSQAQDLLLTALARAVRRWTGRRHLLVDLEGHGREGLLAGVDPSRTVGWFATVYPVLLEAADGDPALTLAAVRQELRAVPRRGIGHGLLRWLGSEEQRAALAGMPAAELSFNYLGRVAGGGPEAGALFRLAPERIGPGVSPDGSRAHLLEINAWLGEAGLEIEWTFSAEVHRRATIEQLAADQLCELRALLAPRPASGRRARGPADFPLAALDQAACDRLQSALAGRGEVEDVYLQSPLQQGMLLHGLLSPGAGMYVAQLICELTGEIDVPAMTAAWRQVVDHHPVLRTAFFWEELKQPVQVVFRRVAMEWAEIDLARLPETAREESFEEYLLADRRRGFDAAAAPLLRLCLCRLGSHRRRLLFTFHQMLLDGWSLPLALADALSAYEAALGGKAAELPARRPYRDYIAWWLRQDAGEAAAYWRRALAGARPAPLPRDSWPPLAAPAPPAAGRAGDYAEERLRLPERRLVELQDFARHHRVTLASLAQAAWGLVLGRLSAATEAILGIVVAGRPEELEGIESAVGLFINTLPLRVPLDGALAVADWLREVQRRGAEMRRYQHTPLAEVQSWAGVTPGRPLFESILVFQNYPVATVLAERWQALGVGAARTCEQTHYDLTLVVEPVRELQLTISYPRASFRRPTVARLLRQLQAVLDDLPRAARVAALGGLRAPERHQLLVECNDVPAGGEPVPVVEAFLRHARAHPRRVAAVFERAELTRGELLAASGRLAARLQQLGVGPETAVAVFLERSFGPLVALLAVFRCGGAFVPIDPAQPRERVALLLAESSAAVVVTQSSLLAELPALAVPVVCLDGGEEQAGDPDASPAPVSADPAHLAYVIFTSGSTGRPKAVAVEQRQLAHYVWAVRARLALPPESSFATVSSFATDLGHTAIFPALAGGGCLHILAESRIGDPEAVAEHFSSHPVDCLKIVPSHLAVLLSGHDPAAILPRRCLVLGGEAADPGLVARLRELAPGLDVHNHYGPTETTVGVSTWRLPGAAVGALAPAFPIGRPLAGLALYLLGDGLTPLPAGAAGELFIGGRGVARGYLGQPAATAERFLPDPWGEPGARLYRTGDLARRLADGSVEFLGRMDGQVKVRGHRVEIAEVEAALRGVAGVREAAVALTGETAAERALCGWVVRREGARIAAAELRAALRRQLPYYMVPSRWRFPEALVRLPSGKLDRRALAAGAGSGEGVPERADGEPGRVAPRNPLERRVAEIWAEVLRLQAVGVHDDFFAQLGGHSLLATQAVSRLRRELRLEVPLRGIFDRPTVAGLAALVAELLAGEAESAEMERLLDEIEELPSVSGIDAGRALA